MKVYKYYVIEIMTHDGDISRYYCGAYSEKEAKKDAIFYANKHEVHFKSVKLLRKQTKVLG